MSGCSDSFISRTDSFSWDAKGAMNDIDQYRGVQFCDVLQTQGGALGVDPRAIHIDSKGGSLHYDVLQTESGATMVSFGCHNPSRARNCRRAESLPPPESRKTLSPRFTQLEHTIRADKLASLLRQPGMSSDSLEVLAHLHQCRLGWNKLHHLGRSALEEAPMNLVQSLENGSVTTRSASSSVKPCVENVARPFRAVYHPTRYSYSFVSSTDQVACSTGESKPSLKNIEVNHAINWYDSAADGSSDSSLDTPGSALSIDSIECFKKTNADEEDDIASVSTRAGSRKSSRRLSEYDVADLSAKAQSKQAAQKHEPVKVQAQPKDAHRRPLSRRSVGTGCKPCKGKLAHADPLQTMTARMKQTYDADGGLGRLDVLQATLARMKQVAQEVSAEYD